MPNESKAWLILEDVVTSLRKIRKDDGYWNDMTDDHIDYFPSPLDSIPPSLMPYAEVNVDDEDVTIELLPQSADGRLRLTIRLLSYDEDRATRYKTRERWIKDVRKKLMEAPNRGANSIDTRITRVDRVRSEQAYEGVLETVIEAIVHYRSDWTDP